MNKCNYPYRVFISYSHADLEIAERLESHILALGAIPVFDKHMLVGTRFTDEIKRRISNAHIFISVLTKNSKLSPWAHQELGFAIGQGVPLLPLAFDELPEGMAQEIQANPISSLSEIKDKLTAKELNNSVLTAQEKNSAVHECADLRVHRTAKLVNEAKLLLRNEGACKLRQISAFSSFSIPLDWDDDAAWSQRSGENLPNSHERQLLSEERIILEKHAQGAGCDLIMDPFVLRFLEGEPSGNISLKHRRESSLQRLVTVSEFLAQMPDDNVRIVIQRGQVKDNITILGDWLSAEAVVPQYQGGYKQTMFTRHGPTVLKRIEEFDRRFNRLLRHADLNGRPSKLVAMEQISQLMKDLS